MMTKDLTSRKTSMFTGLAIAAFALIGLSGTAMAQHRNSASADASAKIVSGITLEKTRDLNFGSIVRSASGGTVTINATSGALTYTGVTRGQTNDQTTAAFRTTGESSYLYTISFPESIRIGRQNGNGNGSAQMTVRSFTASEGAGTLSREGTQSFNVGATLEVGANQETGQYNGSFEVTVQYQ